MRTEGRIYALETGTHPHYTLRRDDGEPIGYTMDHTSTSQEDAEHLARCWNEIEAIGGDPTTVRRMIDVLRTVCDHATLALTRAGVAGYRQTATGEWVSDPYSQAVKEARELLKDLPKP